MWMPHFFNADDIAVGRTVSSVSDCGVTVMDPPVRDIMDWLNATSSHGVESI